ncbi:MAG TPA: hypothetical protein VKB26_03785, partial [Candidatus Acidoferrales bacterium]|nr:hypothetical protein [Candidatus Acidoferrales bacterium]
MKMFTLRAIVLGAALFCFASPMFAQTSTGPNIRGNSAATSSNSAPLPRSWQVALTRNGSSCGVLGVCPPVHVFSFQRTIFQTAASAKSPAVTSELPSSDHGVFALTAREGLASTKQSPALPLVTPTNANWNGGAGNWSSTTMWSTGVVPNGNYNVF